MKKISVLILSLILALTLAACGGNGNTDSNGESKDNGNSGGETFEYGQDYINEKLGDYHLVYTVSTYSGGETGNADIEVIKTPEGYYYGTDGSGQIFVKNGDKYDVYAGSDGEYQSMGIQYEKDMVEGMITGVSAYMTAYGANGSDFKRDGSETVAGRDCAKYTYTVGSGYIYTYSIDKNTGVCLKLKIDIDGQGIKAGFEFEATTFKTSGVKLPDYQ